MSIKYRQAYPQFAHQWAKAATPEDAVAGAQAALHNLDLPPTAGLQIIGEKYFQLPLDEQGQPIDKNGHTWMYIMTYVVTYSTVLIADDDGKGNQDV